tara:strand:+ start:330 stop:473 length:144 start_codon:yes stop_codon:yes gene_type:complete
MPGMKYSSKQMKIAKAAEPRNKIDGKDFAALRQNKPKKSTLMSKKNG